MVFTFLRSYRRAGGDSNTAKSRADMPSQKPGRSLVLNYISIRNRGVIMQTAQILLVPHYSPLTLLSEDVILLLLSDRLITRLGFEQPGNEVVVLDHQTELPQRS